LNIDKYELLVSLNTYCVTHDGKDSLKLPENYDNEFSNLYF